MSTCCDHCEPTPPRPTWRGPRLVAGALLLGGGLTLEAVGGAALPAFAVYVASALLTGPETLAGAWRSLRRRRLGMSFLMAIAAIGAIAIDHAEEGAAVLLLFAVAEVLERRAEGRAQSSIAALLQLAPPTVRVRRLGEIIEVRAEGVRVGEVVVLRPGERVAVDGVVVAGGSSVNESAITGESMPADKEIGAQVFAGSLVNEGYLELQVHHAAGETVLARIVDMVDAARARRSRAERFVDRFAAVYTPVVVGIAAAVAVLPPLVGAGTFADWLYRGLVLLVTACPCALAISTPVSFVSALGAAARRGVLVKGSEFLEAMASARAVAFDKTGTLTEGRPVVRGVTVLRDGGDVREYLAVLAALESRSDHPVARAIVEHAGEAQVRWDESEAFASITGRGVEASYRGRRYVAGNLALLRERGISVAAAEAATDAAPCTQVALADDDGLLAVVAVEDRPRDSAAAVVAALQRQGMQVAMLTGDTEAVAHGIATRIGIDDVAFGLLPADKIAAVRRLRAAHGAVVAIGDGINDAPALAEATVGIAMGQGGADVALETADVVLMHDQLQRVPWLIEHSHRTLRIVRQNIVVAIGVKAIIGALAVAGVSSLWIAVAVGDMGLSLAVTANALRLGRRSTNEAGSEPGGETGRGPSRLRRQRGQPVARPLEYGGRQ